MSSFDPSPGQPNDPNYIGYSRVTAQPEANQAGKIALTTAGEGIAGTVALGDELIKGHIHDTAYAQVDKERDQFTQGLQAIKGQLDNNIPAAVATPGGSTTGSWLDSNDSTDQPDLPAGLESGLSRIQQLTLAKQQGSMKINDTQYAMNTLGVAKQLRAQFPGYRDYIDDEVSKASGLPVANSYYQNLMMDINRQLVQQGQKKDSQGDLMVWGMKEGVPHMDTYIDQRTSQDPKYPGDAFVRRQINSWTTLKVQQGIDAAQRAESKDDRNTQVDKTTQGLTGNLNDLVFHHIQDNLALSGMPDLRSVLTYMDAVKAGKIQTNDAEVQQRTQQLQAYRNYIYQEGLKMGQGPATLLGGKTVIDSVNAALAPIDGYIALANDKDSGSAFFHLHQNQAIKEDDVNRWLVSHDTGALSRQMMTARTILGEQYFPDWIRSMLQNGADKPYADLFNQEALNSISPINDKRGQPIQRYMVDAIQHGKAANVPEAYNGDVVSWINKVTDPQLPMAGKDKLVDWAFNPKNTGILDEFKMDYRDPNTGQVVDGKYRAFNIMTSPTVTKSIAETARVHPENYQKFQNWSESSFASLYRSDLQTLDQITQKPYLNAHFAFNDVTNQFSLVDNNGKPVQRNDRLPALQYPNQKYLSGALDILDRVNGGIANLSNVQKYNPQGQGSDASTAKYLLNTVGTLLQSNPNNMAAQAMGRAILKAKDPQATNDDLDKRLLSVTQPPAVNIP